MNFSMMHLSTYSHFFVGENVFFCFLVAFNMKSSISIFQEFSTKTSLSISNDKSSPKIAHLNTSSHICLFKKVTWFQRCQNLLSEGSISTVAWLAVSSLYLFKLSISEIINMGQMTFKIKRKVQ